MTLSRNFFALAAGFIALCVGVAAMFIAFPAEGYRQGAAAVAVVAGVVALLVLGGQARRDLDAVLVLLASFALIVAVCLGAYLYYASSPERLPRWTFFVAIATSIVCGFTTYRRRQHESSIFPDVLGALVPRSEILETEGVQFFGAFEEASAREPHWIAVFLQNCFDGARNVTIRFDAAGQEKYMRFHERHVVDLGPAEVVRLAFPVVAPTYPGKYPLYLSVSVKGNRGSRVRLRRGKVPTRRTKASTTLLMLLLGQLEVGGGYRFTIGPLEEDIWSEPLPLPHSDTIWQPQIGVLSAAVPLG